MYSQSMAFLLSERENLCSVCKRREAKKDGKCRSCKNQQLYNKRYYKKETRIKRNNDRAKLFCSRMVAQAGKCAICGKFIFGNKGQAHLDHDHRTGKIRDVLCRSCNMALGLMKDDPETIYKAATYLELHLD